MDWMQACSDRPGSDERAAEPTGPPGTAPTNYFDGLADEECLRRMALGDRRALGILFKRYHRLVLSIATRILRDLHEAEDVMQEVFVEVFRVAPQFDPDKGNARNWLLQYAYHRSFNRRKYLSLRGYYREEQASPPITANSNGNWKGLNGQECRELAVQALQTLPPVQRQTLEKVFFGGYRLKEVAQEMGVSEGNVRHYYYRGLERLRRFMRDNGHE